MRRRVRATIASRLAAGGGPRYFVPGMTSDDAIRAQWRAHGRKVKARNLLAAVLSGSILAAISLWLFPHSVGGILFGFVIGFFYANAFEYCLHRFLLHAGRGFFYQQHMVHHTTLNSPEAARYVNFSRNPWGVVALFLANAIPFLFLEWATHSSWAAGAFASFAIYYMAFEEIHWRTHMGGWLPKWLHPVARHHLMHHAQDTGRFNVFLPVFDWLISQPGKSRLRRDSQSDPGSRARLS